MTENTLEMSGVGGSFLVAMSWAAQGPHLQVVLRVAIVVPASVSEANVVVPDMLRVQLKWTRKTELAIWAPTVYMHLDTMKASELKLPR